MVGWCLVVAGVGWCWLARAGAGWRWSVCVVGKVRLVFFVPLNGFGLCCLTLVALFHRLWKNRLVLVGFGWVWLVWLVSVGVGRYSLLGCLLVLVGLGRFGLVLVRVGFGWFGWGSVGLGLVLVCFCCLWLVWLVVVGFG